MLIKMLDGGLVDYSDDCYHYDGCPTCDYGSEYINEIDITLTKCKFHIKVSQMYEYVISKGQMVKFFLTENNTIQGMTENEFVDWFKEKFCEMVGDEFQESICGRSVEMFEVKEV